MQYILDESLTNIAASVQSILALPEAPGIEPANSKFTADFALPCFSYAKLLGKNPAEIAKIIVSELKHPAIAKAEAIGGFVNIYLSDEVLSRAIEQIANYGETFGTNQNRAGQQVVIEHTDPNPFKEFHIGHAYSNTVGEALGRLYKASGATVHQVSYHGDVGKHIAMALWGIQQLLSEADGDWFIEGVEGNHALSDVDEQKRVAFLGAAYAKGAAAFKEDELAKTAIEVINKHIYTHDDQAIDELYTLGRTWSFEYFESIYSTLQTGFERSYLESDAAVDGLDIVRQNIGTVFEESDGAVIYRGEKVGLHTRVFINSLGLPTYEAKELGLTFAKLRDYPAMHESVVVTANEIDEYFKVLIAAMHELDADLAHKMRHVSHGMVKLATGKMSSRTGQVIRALDVIDALGEVIAASYQTPEPDAVKLGALKYAFLKHRIGGDIVFDINESVSLEGNSGPYVQYAHARGRSILAKIPEVSPVELTDISDDEHTLIVKLALYPAIVAKATAEFAPHHVCTYLYELTQQFNRFYEKNRIVGDARQNQRAKLVFAYCQVLANGLQLLNIPAPERL